MLSSSGNVMLDGDSELTVMTEAYAAKNGLTWSMSSMHMLTADGRSSGKLRKIDGKVTFLLNPGSENEVTMDQEVYVTASNGWWGHPSSSIMRAAWTPSRRRCPIRRCCRREETPGTRSQCQCACTGLRAAQSMACSPCTATGFRQCMSRTAHPSTRSALSRACSRWTPCPRRTRAAAALACTDCPA